MHNVFDKMKYNIYEEGISVKNNRKGSTVAQYDRHKEIKHVVHAIAKFMVICAQYMHGL